MKYTFITTAFCLCAALILTACDNDANANNGRSPVFESLTLTPNPCHLGDSVVGQVKYSYAGRDIYSTTYTVTMRVSTDSTYVLSWKVIDPTKKDPTFKIPTPRLAGTYTVNFSASRINYSSGGSNGELYGSANTVSATLRVLDN